jgi:hypothetical protein
MASSSVPSGASGGNPQDDIFAKLTGLYEIKARVGLDVDLRSVEIQIFGQGDWQLVMAPRSALMLAGQLVGAVARLERLPDDGVQQAPYDCGGAEGDR